MFGVIVCIVCLGLANFGVEAFREVPNYIDAGHITWNQFAAVLIYHFIWAEK
jgi:hypothetical protein